MFADLKNDYKSISTAEYSKWIEQWLQILAELVEDENNLDDTLDETNEHFSKVCGKSYTPVKYEFSHLNFSSGYLSIYSSDNYKTYRVYYGRNSGDGIKLYEYPHEFYKIDDRDVVDIWTILKQTPVSEVHDKILEQQVAENKNVEKKIRKQLDRIQSAESML